MNLKSPGSLAPMINGYLVNQIVRKAIDLFFGLPLEKLLKMVGGLRDLGKCARILPFIIRRQGPPSFLSGGLSNNLVSLRTLKWK